MDSDQKRIIGFLCDYKDAWTDSHKLRALLMDCIPERKALRTVLVMAYEEGIVSDLNTSSDHNRVLFQHTKRLVDDYAIDERVANWAIETWNRVVETTRREQDTIAQQPKEEILVSHNEVDADIDEKGLDSIKLRAMMMIYDNKIIRRSKQEMADKLIKLVDREILR